jgi:hypothetical protein
VVWPEFGQEHNQQVWLVCLHLHLHHLPVQDAVWQWKSRRERLDALLLLVLLIRLTHLTLRHSNSLLLGLDHRYIHLPRHTLLLQPILVRLPTDRLRIPHCLVSRHLLLVHLVHLHLHLKVMSAVLMPHLKVKPLLLKIPLLQEMNLRTSFVEHAITLVPQLVDLPCRVRSTFAYTVNKECQTPPFKDSGNSVSSVLVTSRELLSLPTTSSSTSAAHVVASSLLHTFSHPF